MSIRFISHLLFRLGLLLVGAAMMVHLASLVAHAWFILPYAYPLDYGEGPLLAQARLIQDGTPLWHIYADPAAPPHIIVNYPPLYPLLTAWAGWLIMWLTDSAAEIATLLGGRIISLLAAIGCAGALFCLTNGQSERRLGGWLALLFLTIPVVREWGVLLRVDMIGVCLGLWGLVALQWALAARDEQGETRWARLVGWATLSGLLLILTLYTKPSLIAAPGAAGLWLLLMFISPTPTTPSRRHVGVIFVLLIIVAIVGGILFGIIHRLSDGWFALHVVTANANRWDAVLASGFWTQQLALRWPLFVGGVGAACWLLLTSRHHTIDIRLPVCYTLLALPTAIGVGKVGAYANYFLELYAGLVWLMIVALRYPPEILPQQVQRRDWFVFVGRFALLVLLGMSMLVHARLWSPNALRQAGILEENPPRLVFGHASIWHDLARESEILAAQTRVQTALTSTIHETMFQAHISATLFTDMPGVAAQAGIPSRVQLFEHRQLFDQGIWSQQSLLVELANGEIPLAVIDYLGNWMTPEMVEILRRRYAMDGSLGTFDMYRPVETGIGEEIHRSMGDGLIVRRVWLNEPGRTTPMTATNEIRGAGNMLVVTLGWEREEHRSQHGSTPDVLLRLEDGAGAVITETKRPLLYGVFAPTEWPAGQVVQHMQPITLSHQLATGVYSLTVALDDGTAELSPPQHLITMTVGMERGGFFDGTGYYVPPAILTAWEQMGGAMRVGAPLTPAVPFAWGTLQCFEYTCLEVRDGQVVQRPVGEQLYLAETLRNDTCLDPEFDDPANHPPAAVCPRLQPLWLRAGGMHRIGTSISGEISRYGYIVQWTKYARLERPLEGEAEPGLGRLGDDLQRLPLGGRYRWP